MTIAGSALTMLNMTIVGDRGQPRIDNDFQFQYGDGYVVGTSLLITGDFSSYNKSEKGGPGMTIGGIIYLIAILAIIIAVYRDL